MVPWFGDLGFIYACRLGVGALRRLFYFVLDVGASGALQFDYLYGIMCVELVAVGYPPGLEV